MRTLRRYTSAAMLAAICALAAGCGSSASTVTSPSSITKCSVTLTGAPNVPAQGGGGRITVNAARECSWSASADGSWLSIKSGSSGQGEGSVEFSAIANPDPVTRRGAVVLNDQRVDVVQSAAECAFSLSNGSDEFPAAGGSGRIELRASSALCSWTAEAAADWIVLKTPVSGRGPATIEFDVVAGAGTPRSSEIRVGGQRFSVAQTAQTCAFAISPAAASVAAAGGSGTIAVTTAAGCHWTASSAAGWLTIAPAEGTGPGAVSYTVAAASGERSGAATIAGRPFAVTQSAQPSPSPSPSPGPGPAPCTYSVEPASHTVGAGGGPISISVTTTPACAWTAESPVPWVALNGAGSFTGSASASFTVAAASGGARSTTLAIAGHPVTISQGAGCSYSVSPETVQIPATGGPGKVTLSTAAGCGWSASVDAGWIQIAGAASGTGPSEISFQVAATTGSARGATLSVGGRSVTIKQAGASCSFAISPEQRSVDAEGGTFDVAVNTSGGCPWTTESATPWIAVRERNGHAEVTVAANSGAPRTGTATIAGRTLTVSQAGAACQFTVRPGRIDTGPSPRLLQIEVRTAASCSWTAVSNDPWIYVWWGGTGTGDGDVTIGIAGNDGKKRTGSLTIAGQTIPVEQRKDDN